MDQTEHPFETELEAETTESVTDEDSSPDCQIAGCDRPGAVPRTLPVGRGEEPIADRYVCRYHHRLFLLVKVAIVVSALTLFLVAFFQL